MAVCVIEKGSPMDFSELKNPELQEKLRAATTPEELLAIAKEEGFELSENELQAVSGGQGNCAWYLCTDRQCDAYKCTEHGICLPKAC